VKDQRKHAPNRHKIVAASRSGLPSAKADTWKELAEQFQSLADEEARKAPEHVDGYLCAHCDYTDRAEESPGEIRRGTCCLLTAPPGQWLYGGGANINLLNRFRSLATRAGVALRCSPGTSREDFWLHRLYVDLIQRKSTFVLGVSSDTDTIRRVCETSATFCSKLEREALESEETESSGLPGRANQKESVQTQKIVGHEVPALTKAEILGRDSLRAAEAASVLCVSERMLRKYGKEGKLDRSRNGRIVVNEKFWILHDDKHAPE